MQINPKSKTVTYSMDSLEMVEHCIGAIEEKILEDNEDVSGHAAAYISGCLRDISRMLHLKEPIQRHDKFAKT